jgi:hypothetical protein
MLLLWFVDGWLVRCPASARASCPQRAPRHIRSDHRNLLVLCFRHGRVIESRVNRRKCVVVVVRRCFAGSASALPCKRESFVFGRRAPRCTSSNQRDPMRLYIESKRVKDPRVFRPKCVVVVVRRWCVGVCWFAGARPHCSSLQSSARRRCLRCASLNHRGTAAFHSLYLRMVGLHRSH